MWKHQLKLLINYNGLLITKMNVGIRWPKMVSNKTMWNITNQVSIALQTERRKWGWIGDTLRNSESTIEKEAFDWNLLEARIRGHPRKRWKRMVQEALTAGKINEVKTLVIH